MIINMDLNNLKMVNDLYGHDYGDKYLKSAAEVMRRTFEGVGGIFRTGGDEFIVLVPLSYDDENTSIDEEKIIESLKSNEILIGRRDGWETELSIAYGFAYYFGDEEIEEVRKRADREMYRMKSKMKSRG
jgi:diguanylate cyclase (GGDEF)-like protein